jgi:peptide/nickel transport system permease protein
LHEQFVRYVGNLAQGDLGSSFRRALPVRDLIQERLGTSLELAAAALVVTLLVSIPLGILAAALTQNGRHKRFELVFTGTTSVIGSIPEYLLGTVLVFLFAVQFQWLPPATANGFDALILPALAISIPSVMTLSRIVRVETLNVLGQDYIRTARSQRLPVDLIYFRHVLPNVLTAALTVSGLIFASIIGGAVIVETVFARSGLGLALVDAVLGHEYVVVQGIALVLGCSVVIVNALVDILIALVDPRSMAREG